MAELVLLTGFELPLALEKIYDCEQFLLPNASPQYADRAIAFATLSGLDLHGLSDDWFCDGTFSNAPNTFYQISTKHFSSGMSCTSHFRSASSKMNQLIAAFSMS